jgi:hypothetical protein
MDCVGFRPESSVWRVRFVLCMTVRSLTNVMADQLRLEVVVLLHVRLVLW